MKFKGKLPLTQNALMVASFKFVIGYMIEMEKGQIQIYINHSDWVMPSVDQCKEYCSESCTVYILQASNSNVQIDKFQSVIK